MMAGNIASTKYENNHLNYGRDIGPSKNYCPSSTERSVTSAKNLSLVPLSGHHASGQQIIISSSNGQCKEQTIAIDEVADHVGKEEVTNEGTQGQGIMGGIEREDEGNADGGELDPGPLAKHDFLVSFLVDARGGSMYGCRHSGIKVNRIQLGIELYDNRI